MNAINNDETNKLVSILDDLKAKKRISKEDYNTFHLKIYDPKTLLKEHNLKSFKPKMVINIEQTDYAKKVLILK